MPLALVVARAALAILTLVAVAATFVDAASRGPVNPFNFFGYFTIQSNLLFAAGLLVTVVAALRRRGTSETVLLIRACIAVYIVLVGLVYAVLLAPLGAEGGVPVGWANDVLHIVTPIAGAIDWLLAPDRRPLPWRRYWLVLIYPLLWSGVVLTRGATDGWVPYPFLDPSQGYGVVALYCVAVAVVFAAVGALVWASSRLPVPGRRTRTA